MDKITLLKSISFFKEFNPKQLASVESALSERKYPKNANIFIENDPCDHAFILKTGKVKGSKYSLDGKEYIVSFFKPGDFFGEACLFSKHIGYPLSTTACEDSEVYTISKYHLKEIILQDPEIALSILEIYSDKLFYLLGQLEGIALKDVRHRIVQYICSLLPKQSCRSDGKIDIYLPASQTEVASKIGTAREQLSRVLSKLSHDGIIALDGRKITILDMERLKSI
ncbi:MAG: Crp/Fnr family transcriptional regulator [bacterium]|nr:MAG: Crp/Fnr family transcriptional regulator [bacterium]